MFQGMKVANVPRSECSTERKFHGSESSLCGLFASGSESAEERKGLDSSTLPAFFRATGLFDVSLTHWTFRSPDICG